MYQVPQLPSNFSNKMIVRYDDKGNIRPKHFFKAQTPNSFDIDFTVFFISNIWWFQTRQTMKSSPHHLTHALSQWLGFAQKIAPWCCALMGTTIILPRWGVGLSNWGYYCGPMISSRLWLSCPIILSSKILLRSYYPIISLIFWYIPAAQDWIACANLSILQPWGIKSQKICCIFRLIFSSIFKLWRGWLHKEQIWLLYPFWYWQIVKRHVWVVRGVPSNKTGWVQIQSFRKGQQMIRKSLENTGYQQGQWWIIRLWWCESFDIFPDSWHRVVLQEGDLSDYPDTKTTGTSLQSKSDRMSVWKVKGFL